MKEKNKYYTPKIEEFCVGFEYEFRIYKTRTEVWRKFQFLIDDEFTYLYDFEEELSRCRVKYLDQQDIEELGFTKDKKESSKFDFILGTKFTLGNYNLYLADVTGRVIITANDLTRAYDYGSGHKENTLFNGKIKHKSKLKEVLQMIGVL